MLSVVRSSVLHCQMERKHQGRAITKLFTKAGSRPVSAGASSAPRPPTAACRTGTCRLVSRFENTAAVLLAACPYRVALRLQQVHRSIADSQRSGTQQAWPCSCSPLHQRCRAARAPHSARKATVCPVLHGSRANSCAVPWRSACPAWGLQAPGRTAQPSGPAMSGCLARSCTSFKRVAKGSTYLIAVLRPGFLR